MEGRICWGDLMVPQSSFKLPPHLYVAPRPQQTAADESAFLALNPRIREPRSDTYDLSKLTDAEFVTVMTWVYQKGWHVEEESRDWISAWPLSRPLPPATFQWTPVSVDVPAPVPTPVPVPEAPRRPLSPRRTPQFCRDGPACEKHRHKNCPFVHGDTIPRINRPCGSGATCHRRAQCLFMHPGEVWTKDSVIHRH